MTPTRLTVLCAGAGTAVTIAIWGAVDLRSHTAPPIWVTADNVATTRQPATRSSDSNSQTITGSSGAPAPHGASTARPNPNPTKHPRAAAAPFVQQFAAQPGVKPLRPQASPKTTVNVTPNVDGCDHNYGTKTQCIPLTFPDGVTDKCRWLKEHDFTAVLVAGEDRQKLDSDHDGTACDQ